MIAVIAVLLPISVEKLKTGTCLEVGDLMWQALMTACVFEIEVCIELFAAIQNLEQDVDWE
jgi:hypothetical protein